MIAYLCFWCPHKLVFLQDLNESHLNLHEGKSHSNAVARAPAKRHVAYSRALCLLFRSEPEERRERWRENQGGREEREHYLSGSNFSGSGQYSGLCWRRWMGSWTVVPLGMVTLLISMVFRARREVLYNSWK